MADLWCMKFLNVVIWLFQMFTNDLNVKLQGKKTAS